MAAATLTGVEFKKQLRAGTTKLGLFVNSHSPTVAEQLAHSGYDWLLVDLRKTFCNAGRNCQRRSEVYRARWWLR
jgi:2-keto-3-deoxy-L-rhamnonate aldolase RhmA